MVRHRNLARRQADRILAWDFDRVILSHSQPLEGGGHRAFRDAYAWL
jgi:hypothetical protein